jgi:outer membrane protein assembly factor BamA
VIFDEATHTDSIVAYFRTGERIKIGNIQFVDSTNGQQVLANSTKQKLIRLNSGDYYNSVRIERSIDNLLSTGVFESVVIDTLAKDYGKNDSTRDFVIMSKYRQLREWNASPFLNKTQVDELVNAGVEASIIHRNLFGSAQFAKLYTKFSFKDVNRLINNFNAPDIEFKIGMQYAQPMLWVIDATRVSLSSSLDYSLEVLNGLFKVSKIAFPVSFPARLPWRNYFSNFNLQFEINREVPLNYNDVVNYALDSAKTLQDTNNILSALTLYNSINNYLNESGTHLLTSNLVSASLTGDSRDNPFSPTTGGLTYLGIDGYNPIFFFDAISGAAKYVRLQASHSQFWKLSNTSVLGIKGRLGLTYLFGDDNTFVPQDKQFFCGGANSLRAWPARELRYSTYLNKVGNSTIDDFSKNYIGSRTVIEGSIELRKKLSDLPGISDNIAWIFNDIGIGLFVDIGNAFGWFAEGDENVTKLHWTDYITKLAVDTGFGFRYDTPIGPIRLDFATPIYDPMHHRPAFWDLTVQFGIGHAF